MLTTNVFTEEVIPIQVVSAILDLIPERWQKKDQSFDLMVPKRLSTSRRLQFLPTAPFILLTKVATAAVAPMAMPRITTIPVPPNTAMSSRHPRAVL